MKLIWFGSACFALESGDDRILFDPFIELKGAPNFVSMEELLEYDTVFVTHCHFDHFFDAVELAEQSEGDVSVFCTRQCCETAENFLGDTSNFVQIDPGRSYDIGSITIDVLRSRHIDFQWSHVFDTLSPFRMIRYAGNLPFLFWANRAFREEGESVAFLIHAEGKQVLVLGSLAIDPDQDYPKGADLLVLPYQGNNNLPARAKEVLEVLQPKRVMLSHFDNAFPPMSRDVDLRPLKKMMSESFPKIKVVRPTAGRAVTL